MEGDRDVSFGPMWEGLCQSEAFACVFDCDALDVLDFFRVLGSTPELERR